MMQKYHFLLKLCHQNLHFDTIRRINIKSSLIYGKFVMAFQSLQNTFQTVRSGIFGAAVALPVAITGLAVTANDAYAQDSATTVAAIEVPMSDSRGLERDGIQMLAARASNKKRQIVVLYGPTNETFNEVREGLVEFISSGEETSFRGLIVASGDPEIAYYRDGQLTATLLKPSGSDLSDRVLKQLRADYQQLKPDQITQIDIEADTLVPETN